jgi:hypothetical protein
MPSRSETARRFQGTYRRHLLGLFLASLNKRQIKFMSFLKMEAVCGSGTLIKPQFWAVRKPSDCCIFSYFWNCVYRIFLLTDMYAPDDAACYPQFLVPSSPVQHRRGSHSQPLTDETAKQTRGNGCKKRHWPPM